MAGKPDIYAMELHDLLMTDEGYHITRVPGGWIYRLGRIDTGVFVPYDYEFAESEE